MEEIQELYQQLNNEEAKRLFMQEFFLKNFNAFIHLLGYRDLGKFHQAEIEKLQQFRFLTDEPVRNLYLWSRGFFKTSLITIAHNLWLIVNNPDIRILIPSFSIEVAKKPLGAIKQHFMTNSDFRYFFKEFCPQPNKDGKVEFGTTEAFTIPNRTKNLMMPTVMVSGVGTNITGLHFDVISPDDLVNRDSVTNDEQIQASKDYFSLLNPLFDNPVIPRFKVSGTIYHWNDLHSELRKNPKWVTSTIPVHDENYKFIFPERIPQDKFENEILNDPAVNPYDIQAQYLLRPADPKDAIFKDEWFEYYAWEVRILLEQNNLAEYICVDPASTQKKKSDFTVIQRWGKDWQGNDYLIEGIRDKLTVFQRIDKIVEIAKHCKNLVSVKYEVLGGRHGDLESLRKRFFEEGIPIDPSETKSTSSSKRDRISQRLVIPFHAGMIYFPQSLIYKSEYDGKPHDFVQEYRSEYLTYPNCILHDDILDCHSQMFEDLQNLIKGTKPANIENKKWGTADDWEREYNFYDKNKAGIHNCQQALETLRFRNIQKVMGRG